MSSIAITAVHEADSRDVHISTPVFWDVALRRWVISDVSKESVVAFIFKGSRLRRDPITLCAGDSYCCRVG
jgi:hypothetical protein